jgi:hypothetical protein
VTSSVLGEHLGVPGVVNEILERLEKEVVHVSIAQVDFDVCSTRTIVNFLLSRTTEQKVRTGIPTDGSDKLLREPRSCRDRVKVEVEDGNGRHLPFGEVERRIETLKVRLGEVLCLGDEAAVGRTVSATKGEEGGKETYPSISFAQSTSFNSSLLNSSINPSILFSFGATSLKTRPKRRKTSGGEAFVEGGEVRQLGTSL